MSFISQERVYYEGKSREYILSDVSRKIETLLKHAPPEGIPIDQFWEDFYLAYRLWSSEIMERTCLDSSQIFQQCASVCRLVDNQYTRPGYGSKRVSLVSTDLGQKQRSESSKSVSTEQQESHAEEAISDKGKLSECVQLENEIVEEGFPFGNTPTQHPMGGHSVDGLVETGKLESNLPEAEMRKLECVESSEQIVTDLESPKPTLELDSNNPLARESVACSSESPPSSTEIADASKVQDSLPVIDRLVRNKERSLDSSEYSVHLEDSSQLVKSQSTKIQLSSAMQDKSFSLGATQRCQGPVEMPHAGQRSISRTISQQPQNVRAINAIKVNIVNLLKAQKLRRIEFDDFWNKYREMYGEPDLSVFGIASNRAKRKVLKQECADVVSVIKRSLKPEVVLRGDELPSVTHDTRSVATGAFMLQNVIAKLGGKSKDHRIGKIAESLMESIDTLPPRGCDFYEFWRLYRSQHKTPLHPNTFQVRCGRNQFLEECGLAGLFQIVLNDANQSFVTPPSLPAWRACDHEPNMGKSGPENFHTKLPLDEPQNKKASLMKAGQIPYSTWSESKVRTYDQDRPNDEEMVRADERNGLENEDNPPPVLNDETWALSHTSAPGSQLRPSEADIAGQYAMHPCNGSQQMPDPHDSQLDSTTMLPVSLPPTNWVHRPLSKKNAKRASRKERKKAKKMALAGGKPIADSNRGYQLLVKLGWGKKGLGRDEQGSVHPVSLAGVHLGKMRKGLGVRKANHGSAGKKDVPVGQSPAQLLSPLHSNQYFQMAASSEPDPCSME